MHIQEVGIYFPIPHYVSGPAKVAINLLIGLRRLGVEVLVNQAAKYCACLNRLAPNFESLPERCLMGPNLVYKPEDLPGLWAKHRHFVVPSQAVKDFYLESEIVRDCKIHVWSAGIDTERFSAKRNAQQKFLYSQQIEQRDCLVYFKNRQRAELEQVIAQLEQRNISYYIAEYEKYKESDFLNWARNVNYCVLVNGVESQGIAVMELWSCGVPCFALIPPGLEPEIQKNASEDFPLAGFLPYFKPCCGMYAENLIDKKFEEFLSRLARFKPRDYIVNEHSLEVAAKKYLEILQIAHT